MRESGRKRWTGARGIAVTVTRRRLSFALAALLALLVQALAIQTHVHPHRPAIAGPAATVALDDHHSRHPAAPADCPSCRLLADTAVYVTPTTALLVAPIRHAVPGPVALRASTASGGRSHTWRSRGPPPAPAIPTLA